MKRTTIYFNPVKIIMFSMFLLFFGCSKEIDGPITKGEKIKFKVNILNEKEKKATVHPTSNIDFKTAFKVGDEIGVFATKEGVILGATSNPIHNIKLTYNGTGWVGDVNWPSEVSKYDFYAYYPYQPNPVGNPLNPTQIPYRSSSSNEGLDGFAKSDLMSGAVKAVSKGGNVELDFSHKLALLQVEVFKAAGNGIGPNQSMYLELKSNAGSGFLGLINNNFEISIGAFTHYLYRIEQPSSPDYSTKFTYRTYLPAQKLSKSLELLKINNSNLSKSYIFPNAIELKPGEAKIIKVDY